MLLDKQGYSQVLVDINKSGLEKLSRNLTIVPICIESDICESENVKNIKDQVMSTYGRLDVLINNAGIVLTTPFDEAKYEEIDREINVNYKSYVYFMREFIPIMKNQGSGNIVSISSLAGLIPLKEGPGYAGSKFAVRGFMLSQSIALRKFGIGVSVIYPTSVDTPMLEHEALHGGTLLNFVNAPVSPIKVAKAVMKAIQKNKMEITVPWTQGYLCKFLGFFPTLFHRYLPLFEPAANRNRLKYIKRKKLA
jgi:short-subunit dehydrogenase